jgi:hypothetical protein
MMRVTVTLGIAFFVADAKRRFWLSFFAAEKWVGHGV